MPITDDEHHELLLRNDRQAATIGHLNDSLSEARNLLDSTRRDRDAFQVVNGRLDRDLAAVRRQLTIAEAKLAAAGIVLPEPVVIAEWYSCAVCSLKTDLPPVRSLKHDCCGRLALVGPCCETAEVEIVGGIMAGANHAHGCRGGRR